MDASTAAHLPRTLGGWLPFLWTRTLFPGPSPRSESGERAAHACPLAWRSLLLLVVLPAVLLYPCTGFRLFEPDESRYAQIPREMALRGDLILPTLQGEPYLDKPPLLYWLVLGSYQVLGVHDWSARLVPALALHASILLTWLLGRRLLGERSAWTGALLLTLAPGFLGMGRLLILDGLLTLWTTLALFAAFEALRGDRLRWTWWLVAAMACGLGILTKGPVALVLLAPPLWLHQRLTGQGCRPGWWGLATFGGLVLALNFPWYLALSWRMPEFAGYFFWEHNVQRFLTPSLHAQGVWFYAPILLLALFPGSLLTWSLGRFLLAGDEESRSQRPVELGFVLLAGGWCVFFFTLSSGKLLTYILPALPFLALALGHRLVTSRWQTSRLPGLLGGLTFAGLIVAHYLAVPWYANYRSPMSRPLEVLARCTDPNAHVVCYPRNCDSVAFYLGRSDLRTYRSKDIEELRYLVRTQPRTVILCTHRHSLDGLRELLPPDVAVVDEVRLGLPDIPGVPKWLMRPLAQAMGETALGLSDLVVLQPDRSSGKPIPPASPRHRSHPHEEKQRPAWLSVPGPD